MDAIARVLSLIEAGGWVMYPLLVLSVLSLAITFERAVFWLSPAARLDRGLLERLMRSMRTGDWPAVLAETQAKKSIHARYAAHLAAEARRDGGITPSVAVSAAERFRPIIERFAALHATIITAAPMLGILGTVTGIIQSFQLIGGDGVGDQVVSDPSLIAAGIAEALFTTAVGLVVALVTLFPHALFRAASERVLVAFETIAAAADDGADHVTERTESSKVDPTDEP
ncbi:MAG: MotA/TolQ/ExbB proton channel family protein [Planctomycetota bacterium]